jgi:hypothetical protein
LRRKIKLNKYEKIDFDIPWFSRAVGMVKISAKRPQA